MKDLQLNIHGKLWVLAVLILFNVIFSAQAQEVFPEDAWGVYTWGAYNPDFINPKKTPQVKGVPTILKWTDLNAHNDCLAKNASNSCSLKW